MLGAMQQVRANVWVLPISGNPLNPAVPTNGTITFSAIDDLVVESTGDAVIVSTTRANDATFRSHTVVISCVNGGSGSIVVKGASKVVSLGNHRGTLTYTVQFYVGTDTTAPRLTWDMNKIPVNVKKIFQSGSYPNILPTTGNKALPTGLTNVYLEGAHINWTYSGALPTGLTSVVFNSPNIDWTYSGALPIGLTLLYLINAKIKWTHDGALPIGLTSVFFNGNNINWTSTTFGNTGTPKPNMSFINFTDYRTDTMDYTDLLSMLNSLINNVGTLPTTVIIREQIPANVTSIAAASPNETGTDAEKCKYYINFIKSTKGVTTFTLNTTGI